MTRRADWQRRLREYLAERARTPFAWGRHDCALFTAGAVAAMTGTDPARGMRGYRTAAGGAKKLRAAGHADHVAAARALLPPADRPRPGDVAVVALADGERALGIVQGTHVYVAAPVGWALVPLEHAIEFLKVG